MTLIKNVIMQCDVIRVIFAYQTKSNISRKKRASKILPKRLHIVILNYLCNAIKKTFGEISLHRHFKSHFRSLLGLQCGIRWDGFCAI